MATKIGWCTNPDGSPGETLNVVFGCTKKSQGCRFCYAERMAKRLRAMGQANYRNATDKNGWTGDVSFDDERLEIPARWRKPRTVFLNSMSDTFHEHLKEWMINRMLLMVYAYPMHRFILVTKRPERAKDLINEFCEVFNGGDPVENLWLLVSVENQETFDDRVPHLLATNVVVRGLSMEPLLENVDMVGKDNQGSALHPYENDAKVNWVICGFESGPGCRVPADANEIAHNIMVQCDGADVPFYMKQMGGHPNKRDKKEDIPRYLWRWSYPEIA